MFFVFYLFAMIYYYPVLYPIPQDEARKENDEA